MKLFSLTMIGLAAAQQLEPTTTSLPTTTGMGSDEMERAKKKKNSNKNKNNNNNNNYNNNSNNNNVFVQPEPQEPQVAPQPSEPYSNPSVPAEPMTDDQCFACNEQNLADCSANGSPVQCRQTAEGITNNCFVEIRKQNGIVNGVIMGCKEQSACLQQKENNFKFDGRKARFNECKPNYKKGASKCYSCCKGKNCFGTKLNNFVFDGDSNKSQWN